MILFLIHSNINKTYGLNQDNKDTSQFMNNDAYNTKTLDQQSYIWEDIHQQYSPSLRDSTQFRQLDILHANRNNRHKKYQ